MNRLPEIELIRLLHGELPPERAFELHERLAREPALAAELRRLEAAWARLELPPVAPAPRGFAREVVARAESGGLWSVAPTRVRAAGFALLAAGLALGIGLATSLQISGSAAGEVAAPSVVASPPVGRSRAPVAIAPAPSLSAVPPASAPTGALTGGSNVPNPDASTHPERTPAADVPTDERMASLDYDLPADDGPFADEGTLADDFWQAWNGTETAAGTGDSGGTGSEGL